jgi:hypothetical protein
VVYDLVAEGGSWRVDDISDGQRSVRDVLGR